MLKIDASDSQPRVRQKLNKNSTTLEKAGTCTGFVTGLDDNNSSIVVTYDSSTRKVTLTGTFEAYYQGTQVTELTTGWVSPAHNTTTGVTYFLRYDGTQFLFDTNPWAFSDMMIASVQYGATNKICLREVHGLIMDGDTHLQLHENLGTTRRLNGTIFNNYTLNSTTEANRRPQISGVKLMDEDLETDVNSLTTNSYTLRYLTGSAVRTFTTGSAEIVKLNAGVPRYNLNTGGTWSDADFPNNHYGAIFVVATPAAADSGSQPFRYMFVQPQETSLDLSVIQALTPADLTHGDSSSLLAEYNFIGKIIIQYTAANWKLISVEALIGNRTYQIAYANAVDPRFDATTYRFISTAAAATDDKGTFAGYIHNDALIDIAFSNGNTATSPTITIGGVVYTISGMPTVAKLSTSTYQSYKFRKLSENTLTFITYPDYTTEYGTSGDFKYERRASGMARLYMTASNSTGTLTMTQISTSQAWVSQDLSLALPTGLFNNAGYTALMTIYSRSYVISLNTLYDTSTANALSYCVIKNGSSTSAVSFRATIDGTWK